MFGINTGLLGKLAKALINGDDNIIEKLVFQKLEDLGENLISDALESFIPTGPIRRVERAIKTGGASEFNRLRNQWLSSVRPPPVLGLNRLQSAFERAKNKAIAKRRTQWGRTEWATSRQDWLDNRWRHDWRSQPRDVRGRWIPGRLDYIAPSLMYRGQRAGRALRAWRQRRRVRRAAVRRMVRNTFR